jgi:LemA protein
VTVHKPRPAAVLIGLRGSGKTTLGRLLAVAEAYPDLKANQNFLQLQGTLGQLEGEIAFARTGYNGQAGDFNTQLAVFPNNVIAGMFRFQPFRFFEVGEGERESPKVRF